VNLNFISEVNDAKLEEYEIYRNAASCIKKYLVTAVSTAGPIEDRLGAFRRSRAQLIS
jgi:hypothetical protein